VALPAAESPRVPVTPLARRLARQRGLALERVRGSGPNGRIRARDLPALRPGRLLVLAAAELSRRRALAVQVAPQFLLAREAEISTLLACRERLNAARPTPRYTLNHFVVAALGRALMELPELNRVWTDDGPLMLERSDVGLAAATAQGSAAPLLREAGHLSLPQIAQACVDIEERARSGRLGADACIGGAVTVHHAGLYRLNALAAPLQSGQSMSLATGSVCDGFGADAAGRPVLRRELTLTLAADARVFEADAAAALLRRTVQHLEQVQELLQPPPARAPS
jgi:pyruvate dehydrogenase E2 component (dihydrolipoamide acetyltransferase)